MNERQRFAVTIGSRFRSLTSRQAAAVASAAVLGAGAATFALAGGHSLALALLGPLGALNFVAVLQARRRMGQEIGALRADVAKLTERIVFAQRQIVAAVEDERLTGADRHEELMRTLSTPAARGEARSAADAGIPDAGAPAER